MLSRRPDARECDSKKFKRSLFSFGSKATPLVSPPSMAAPPQGPLQSIVPPKVPKKDKAVLRSSSAPSEVPSDWPTFNKAYANGLMDFDDPPPPPSKLEGSNVRAPSGQYRAPAPLNEKRRQRSVESLGMITRVSRAQDRFSTSSASSISSSDSSASSISSTSTVASSLSEPLPKDLPSYDTLQRIAVSAAERFGTGVCSISLMDGPNQVFLAEVGLGVPELNRDCTVCSHAMLKATTGQSDPFVVLDLARDWRFTDNNFGRYHRGFYAAVPLSFPAPFGDATPSYPGGIFCLLDDKPRREFTDEERADLASFADEAGAEIARYQSELRKDRTEILVVKREEWRRSKLVKKVAVNPSLDTVVEVVTPPTSPHFVECDADSRRPSLSRSTTSESQSSFIVTTEVTPTFTRRGNGHSGLHATAAPRLSPDVRSMLDLSTRVIGESLDLDFTYLLEIDLPVPGRTSAMTSKQVRILSSHNAPIPPPLFDVQLHIETLVTAHNALLYSDPSCPDGEFATGLLVKVATVDGKGYCLGGFSENRRRVLNRSDYLFFASFANDLKKYTHLV